MKENHIKQSPMLTLPSLGGGVNSTLVRIGGPTGNFWFAYYNGQNGDDQVNCVATDSNGNIYICGKSSGGAHVVKYDTDGNMLWNRIITGLLLLEWQGVAADSSGNVYVTGYNYWQAPPGSLNYRIMTHKYNSNGTLLWQRRFVTNSNPSHEMKAYAIAIDSQNLPFIGYRSSISGSMGGIAAYSTSGSLSTASATKFGGSVYGHHIGINPNVWKLGYTICLDYNTTIPHGSYLIQKQNLNSLSSGPTWSGVFGTSQGDGAVTEEGHDIVSVNTNGECVFGVTLHGKSASYDGAVAKVNTAGTFQWGRMLGHSSDQLYSSGVAVDDSGNVYSLMINQAQYKMVVAKWNSSGTLQWQREIDTAGVEYGYGQGVAVDNNGAVILSFISAGITGQSGGRRAVIFKVPDNGSLTGTHGDFTYSISNYTESSTVGHATWQLVSGSSYSFSTLNAQDIAESYSSYDPGGTSTTTSM